MMPSKRILLVTLIFVVFLLAFSFWSGLLKHFYFSLPLVNDVVGFSSFQGYQKQIDFAEFDLLIFIAAILFAWLGWKAPREASVMQSAPWVPSRFGWAWFMLVLILIYAYFFPPLYDLSNTVSQLKISQIQWDGVNIVSWDYLHHIGLLPYRDFWYPYGGQIFQGSSFWGQCFYAFQLMFVFTALFYFAICFSRSFFLGSVFIAFLLVQYQLGIFQYMQRYPFPLLLVCCFYIAMQNPLSKKWAFFTGLIAAYLAFFELNLMLGPILGGLIVVILKMLEKDKANIFKSILIMNLTFISFFSLWMLYLYDHGQLIGYFNFYSPAEFRSMANYAFEPANVLELFQPRFNFEFLTFILFVITVMRSSYLIIRDRFKLKSELIFLIPISITMMLLFFKDLCRPWMSHQMVSFIVPAFLFWMMIGPLQKLKKIDLKRIQIAALLILTYLLIYNLQQVWNRASYGYSQVKETFFDFSGTQKRFELANKKHFYVDISSLSKEQQELVAFLHSSNVSKVYVLGDASWIYIVRQQAMPFYINHYNGSRIVAQNKNIEWIEKNQIKTLVWDANNRSWDGVAHEVRAPILFEYLIRHFIFQKRIGSYLVFQRSDEDIEKNRLSWKEVLSFSEDVGAIPYASQLLLPSTKTSNCVAGSENCFPVLMIRSKNATVQQNKIFIKDNKREFLVLIKNYNSGNAFLRLDRLWFWPLIQSNAVSFRSSTADTALVWKSLKKDWPLY